MSRFPQDVRRCFAAWLALWAVIFAAASVPAFSPPWTVPETPERFALIQYWWPWLVGVFTVGSGLLLLPAGWRLQISGLDSIRRTFDAHRALFQLLLVATLLRFIFVMRGGQYFDSDETRYGGSATWMFAYVSTGNLHGALDVLLRAPDHPGFRVVGLFLAFFHVVSAWATGRPITEMRSATGEWLPAFLLSLASVCSIGLTYALAIRAGASRRESFLAAFLMFASSSMLIYVQHFFPYDVAMAIFMFALWMGIEKTDHPLRSFGAGLLCGLAFLIYEGYWLLVALVGCMHGLRRPFSIPAIVTRGLLFSAGTAMFPALLVVAGRFEGRPFLQALQRFSHSAVNGDFSEGWSLPWEYLWNVEHALLFVYAAGIIVFVIHYVRRKDAPYGLMWLSAAGALYLGLVAGSNLLHRFVVYDRLAREMLPFICLVAAAGLARVREGQFLRGTSALVFYGSITLLLLTNAAPLLLQRYPRDIALDVVRRYGAGNVRLEMTVPGSDKATETVFLPFANGTPREPSAAPQRYVLVNAMDIWVSGGASKTTPPPRGEILFATGHPRQLRSMQYHGYLPRERAFLRSVDLSIRLIDTRGIEAGSENKSEK